MGDEDFFSDDDLDGIPDNTLRELEQNALASTQLSKPAGQAARYAPKPGNNRLIGAPRQHVKQSLPWRPPQPARPPPVHAQPSGPPASAPAPPSSDYGLGEEDVIDLDEPSMVVQPASRPRIRLTATRQPSAAPTVPFRAKPVLDPETEAAFAAADAELDNNTGQWEHAPHLQPRSGDGLDLSALQKRVAELEAESNRLRQAEETARNAAAIKAGEIAIVRSNQEKAAKEYERRIAVMQKLHADEATKVKAELEASRKEREKMQTDNRFLQHDLEQESERVRRVNGSTKARSLGSTSKERDTPRKAKKTSLGDGFDDLEVRPASPSWSRDKAKDGTPKHGAKRKRTANDSPVVALSFTKPPEVVRQDSAEQWTASIGQVKVAAPATDDRYQFMQRLLNHRPHEGHERSIEALAKYTVPSDPKRSLSSALLDRLSYPAATDEPDYLPLKLSRAVLKLWTQCLDTQHYDPLYLLLDLINFALYLELASIKAQLIEQGVPLCIRTVDLIAAPTMRASSNPTYAALLEPGKLARLADELCADEVMDFLRELCGSATLCPGRIEVFWGEYMEVRFTLLMLNKAQPISQINAMLEVLSTSALPSSFGPIRGDAETQAMQETGIVDRLTSLLFEMPELPAEEPAYTETEIAELRLEILAVLKALCRTDHGGELLAQNRSAVGRLIRFLDGQVNRLYTLTPPPRNDLDSTKNNMEAPVAPHALVARTINMTTILFYHLLRTYPSIDLTAKLNVIHGGNQKFLVCMSRVAFSEQLVLEYGIEDAVTEAAHEILDGWLSPEEGEAVVRGLETPVSKGSIGSGEVESARAGAQVDGAGDTTMSDPD